MKKLLSLCLVAFLTGCGPAEESDPNTLMVWHWMSDRDASLQELAKRYESETHIQVRFELFAPSEAYAQRVKASAQTSTLPDIYGILGEKRDLASFIRSGHVEDLTASLSADGGSWKKAFLDKALAAAEFLPDNEYGVPPGFYGVPLDITAIEMLYNRDIYRKVGLDPDAPPTTWEDFLQHSRLLKQKGYACLVGGFGEIWMLDALASNWAMNLMGEGKVFDTYAGKMPYTDPDWVRVFTLFKEIADGGYLMEGAVTMVNKTAEQTFANERAAYAFNGSWCVNVYKGMNPRLDYAPFPPPAVNPNRPMRIWGGTGSSFVVNARSARRDKAVAFLKWLTLPEQQAYLASQTENLPAAKANLEKTSPVLAQFADDMRLATHPSVYPVREIPAVSEAFCKGIQFILIGEKTPEAVAQEVQRLKEKETEKAKK